MENKFLVIAPEVMPYVQHLVRVLESYLTNHKQGDIDAEIENIANRLGSHHAAERIYDYARNIAWSNYNK